MVKKKKVIILGIALLIVGAYLLIRYAGERDLQGELRLSGNVEVTEVNLGFKIPGRIVALQAQEGDHVKAGTDTAV